MFEEEDYECNSVQDYKSCTHDEIIDAICLNCGVLVNSQLIYGDEESECVEDFDQNCIQNSSADRGVLVDLEEYSCFPIEVKIKANEIYKKMKSKTYKQSHRKYMLIHVVCEAYYLLNSPKDPRIICTYFDMKTTAALNAYNRCHCIYTGYQESYSKADAIDYIAHYCHRLGFESKTLIQEIIDESQDIFNTLFEDLEDESPQSVAIGLILYYCRTHGYESIQVETASKACLLSNNIILEHYRLISDLVADSLE